MLRLTKLFIFCLLLLLCGCTKSKDITITFQTNGGDEINPITTKANQEIELPTPTKTGYKFVEYYDLDGNKYTSKASFLESITLYVNWEIKEYTVRFYDYDNSLISEQLVKYKKDAKTPAEPIRTNYVFTNWDKEYSTVTQDLDIYAQYEEATNGLIYELEEDGYAITSYTGSSLEVIIPSMYKGYKVTSIGDEAFNQAKITKITLPNTIKIIGIKAFYECFDLQTINIPTSVDEIKDEAFMNCSSLVAITIPTPIIGKSAFYNCSFLKDITLLNTVTTIKDSAFQNLPRLITLYVPSSVTSVGPNVIAWCQNLEYIYTEEEYVLTIEKLFKDAGYIYANKVKFTAKP